MASPFVPNHGRGRLITPKNLCVLFFLAAALFVLLEITLFIPLRVSLVTHLLLRPGRLVNSPDIALTYITRQTRRLGEVMRVKTKTNYLNLRNEPNFLSDIVWLWRGAVEEETGIAAEDGPKSAEPQAQAMVLEDEDGDGDLDPFIQDYDQAIDFWINPDEPVSEQAAAAADDPSASDEALFAPITVTQADVVAATTRGTTIPPIALAAAVEIQAPGRWDDLATVTLKCSVGDCDPSVGIGQIRPSEVEQFTRVNIDRFFVNLALMNSPELSIRMMHAKLVEAQARFEWVCQGRCTTTDYFLMYACAHNGMSTHEMELAINYSWETALALNDLAFARGDWPEGARYRLYGNTGDRRWFIRDYVALLEELQGHGYTLPPGIDLDYMRSLGKPRWDRRK